MTIRELIDALEALAKKHGDHVPVWAFNSMEEVGPVHEPDFWPAGEHGEKVSHVRIVGNSGAY